MKARCDLRLTDEEGVAFFGAGPYRLLQGVAETGSLRASAAGLNMSYSKATRLLHRAETVLGFPLTRRTIGGTAGGGSVLTDQAKELMMRYDNYTEGCRQAAGTLFDRYFGGFL